MCTTAQAGMGFFVTMIKSSGAVQGHSFLAEFDEDFLRLRWTAIDDVVPLIHCCHGIARLFY